jgi:hypothetical protein
LWKACRSRALGPEWGHTLLALEPSPLLYEKEGFNWPSKVVGELARGKFELSPLNGRLESTIFSTRNLGDIRARQSQVLGGCE